MNRIIQFLFGATIVAMFVSVPATVLCAFCLSIFVSLKTLAYLYKNRLLALPEVKIKKEEEEQRAIVVRVTPEIGRNEIGSAISQRAVEKAYENGYSMINEVPRSLKI